MRNILIFFFLSLLFQALASAEDISDFEIEGISIGDSALEYFSKKNLKQKKKRLV